MAGGAGSSGNLLYILNNVLAFMSVVVCHKHNYMLLTLALCVRYVEAPANAPNVQPQV